MFLLKAVDNSKGDRSQIAASLYFPIQSDNPTCQDAASPTFP
ncbi:hypothetical protein [Nostoc sp.]